MVCSLTSNSHTGFYWGPATLTAWLPWFLCMWGASWQPGRRHGELLTGSFMAWHTSLCSHIAGWKLAMQQHQARGAAGKWSVYAQDREPGVTEQDSRLSMVCLPGHSICFNLLLGTLTRSPRQTAQSPNPQIRHSPFQLDLFVACVVGWPVNQKVRSDQSLSRVRLFATPWIAARQASLSFTNSRSPPKPMSIESVMPSSHLILCRPLLLLGYLGWS